MQTNTYLYFDGACEEAFQLYEKVLGAKILVTMRYNNGPDAPLPANWKEKIMHGRIQLGDTMVFASDAPPGMYSRPQGFRMTARAQSDAEAETIFAALSQGGTVETAMEKTFFASRYGMATDRFGIPWMVLREAMPQAGADLPKTRMVDLTRTVDAPRALVWKVWTDPKHVAQWWGPHGFTNPVCEWDARKGGKILIEMKGMGMDHPMTGEFLEVVPQERLVFTAVARDKDKSPLLEAHTIVTFRDEGGKTIVNVKQSANAMAEIAPQMLAGMEMGWNQSLDKFESEVAAAKKG